MVAWWWVEEGWVETRRVKTRKIALSVRILLRRHCKLAHSPKATKKRYPNKKITSLSWVQKDEQTDTEDRRQPFIFHSHITIV